MSDKIGMSVVVLTCRRPKLLAACLRSVLAADLSKVREILIIINGADPVTLSVAGLFVKCDARLSIREIPRSSRGRARNRAAAAAAGEIIHFLDDDVTVPPDIFSATWSRFAGRPEIAAMGGPNLTPPDSPPLERAIGRVLSSYLGAWRMRARYSPVGRARWAGEESLMLCSLAFRADADGPAGLRFPERLVSAEENLLLERISERGGKLLYDPALAVFHRRRPTWLGFAKQTYQSGAGRFQAALLRPGSLRPVHLAPTAFALYVASLPLSNGGAAFAPLVVYLAWLAVECAHAAIEEGARVALMMTALTPLHHGAYAVGFLLGPFLWTAIERGQTRSTTTAPPMPPPAQAASIP